MDLLDINKINNEVDGYAHQVRSVNVAQCKLLTMQSGVCCCVSYRRTESSVATAYTILYGSENTIVGPGDEELVSTSKAFGFGFGDNVGTVASFDSGTIKGGSMTE